MFARFAAETASPVLGSVQLQAVPSNMNGDMEPLGEDWELRTILSK